VADVAAVKQRSIERVGGRDHDASIFELLDDVVIGADLGRRHDHAIDGRVVDDLIQDLDLARMSSIGASDPSLIRLIPRRWRRLVRPHRQDRRSVACSVGNDCESERLAVFLGVRPLFRSVLPRIAADGLVNRARLSEGSGPQRQVAATAAATPSPLFIAFLLVISSWLRSLDGTESSERRPSATSARDGSPFADPIGVSLGFSDLATRICRRCRLAGSLWAGQADVCQALRAWRRRIDRARSLLSALFGCLFL